MKSYQEFAQEYGLRLKPVTTVSHNPNMESASEYTRHYLCVLAVPSGDTMEVYFSKGPALPEGVTLSELLYSLASDAGTVLNVGDFEEWAEELGFDPDSRKAERTYQTVVAQTERLRRVLGNEAMEDLVHNVEPI